MRRSRKPLVIASRKSALATVQAEAVGRVLERINPGLVVKHLWVTSEGDQIKTGLLHDRGGKGLFTGTVERALQTGEADVAVHSLKDLPCGLTPGLQLPAIGVRADARDVLITRAGLRSIDDLPEGAVVGTSAPRRAAQLLHRRPDLRIVVLRGNVETRLAAVLDPPNGRRFDATLLAAAGLQRLGRVDLLAHALPADEMLPAASQGALAIQCRADDHVTIERCIKLNHAATATAVHAEREVVTALHGDCHSPIAVYAEPCEPPVPAKRNADAHWFRLRVRVLAPDGSRCLEHDERVLTRDLRHLVKRVTADLLDRDARAMICDKPAKPVFTVMQ